MSEYDYTIVNAINAIIQRRFYVLTWVIGTIILIGVITLVMPKSFKSEGKIFVRLGRENASLDATTTLGDHPVVAMPLTREAEINSVTEMIKNRSIYEAIVEKIGAEVILKKADFQPENVDEEIQSQREGASGGIDLLGMVIDPVMAVLTKVGVVNDISAQERAIIKLSKNLEVEPLEKSNVVSVVYECHDANLAQAIVHEVINEYVARHSAVHRSEGAFTFLSEQTERIQNELQECESEFETFKNNTGILEIDQQRKIVIARLADIVDKKLEIDAQLAGAEEEIASLEKALGSMSEVTIIESTTGPGQEGVDAMQTSFFDFQMRYNDLVARYSDEHPEVIKVKEQMEATRKIIDLAENSRKEQIQGRNEVFGQTQVTFVAKKAERDALAYKSEAYQQQINQLQKGIEEFNQNEKEFIRLQRDWTIKDASYRKYANNLEQARIDRSLKMNNLSNISVAQPASLSFKPSKPNKLINLVLAGLFGSMMGVGMALWKDYSKAMNLTELEQEEHIV